MIITNNLNMDLQQPGFAPVIYAVQNDRYCRNLALAMYSGGEIWTIPETASAMVRYRKADGLGGEYDTLPDGSAAWSVSENVLTVALAPQVTTAAGPVQITVVLLDGQRQVSTFSVLLHVQAAVEPVEESEAYVNVTGYLPAPAAGAKGQIIRVTQVDENGRITGVEAVDPLVITEDDMTADEKKLEDTYTLKQEDFIHGVWDGEKDASSDMPYYTDVDTKFCTRKLQTRYVPRVAYSYFTTPYEYVFWKGEHFAGKALYTQLEGNWTVNFEFDQVGIVFSWGWDYMETDVVVQLSISGGRFKKVLVMGDSISADYYGNYPKWVTMLMNEKFFPASTENNSIHATGFVAEYTAEGDVDNNFLHRIQAVEGKEDFDLVIVFGGINDFIQSIPMGESGGDASVNFIPAVESFFDYLVKNFCHARIVVLSPLRTYNVYPNAQGHYQTEYTDFIRQTAQKYCLPVLNLTEESGFYPFVEEFKNLWTLVPEGYEVADGVHPNETWQKQRLAPQIRNYLEQLI